MGHILGSPKTSKTEDTRVHLDSDAPHGRCRLNKNTLDAAVEIRMLSAPTIELDRLSLRRDKICLENWKRAVPKKCRFDDPKNGVTDLAFDGSIRAEPES